jgi:hypothetical protein
MLKEPSWRDTGNLIRVSGDSRREKGPEVNINHRKSTVRIRGRERLRKSHKDKLNSM